MRRCFHSRGLGSGDLACFEKTLLHCPPPPPPPPPPSPPPRPQDLYFTARPRHSQSAPSPPATLCVRARRVGARGPPGGGGGGTVVTLLKTRKQ
eukprot:9482565-Pyramimonas_sp.AAC.1